jgi:putative metallopeptidase
VTCASNAEPLAAFMYGSAFRPANDNLLASAVVDHRIRKACKGGPLILVDRPPAGPKADLLRARCRMAEIVRLFPEPSRLKRPAPPAGMIDPESLGATFAPAPDLERRLRSTFIEEGAPLQNEDHFHLRYAEIGVLWTSIENSRHGRRVVSQAERGNPTAMGRWAKARAELQVVQWFGDIPDFILTFDASCASMCTDTQWCALVEHELSHCGVERDAFGAPKFGKSTGLPSFTLVGHDVEEFVGVVRRYGADATGVRVLVDAANAAPSVAAASISAACGSCRR